MKPLSSNAVNFQTLFESAPGLYLVLDPEFMIVGASNAYQQATMTKRQDIVGRSLFDVFPDNPNDPAADGARNLKASLERVLKNKIPDTMAIQKYDIRKPESEGGAFEVRYWSPFNSPVFDENGSIIYIIHRVEDVTDFIKLKEQGNKQLEENMALRTQAEKMELEIYLRAQEVAAANKKLEIANHELELLYTKTKKFSQIHLRAIVDHMLDGLISIDEHGIIESFNPACERIFGYNAHEIIGRNIKILMPEPYHHEHDQYISNYITTGKAKIIGTPGREVSGKHKDGSIFPIDLSISSFQLEDGRHFSGIIRDITAQKKAKAELLHYMEALERSNRELDDFAYIASHDLKEPLRGLFNNAKFLQEDYQDKLNAEGCRRLERLLYLSGRMEQLVNDLLYFSRLGSQELAIQSTDLNDTIKDIESMMETTLKEQNAVITIPHPLPTIICDKIRITEAFRNLITNAVKYNDKDQKIIEIGYIEPQETFYVRDNGIGIRKEFFEVIFRIFKRLTVEDDDKKGSGVGLTFVRKIIERHGGHIWLESEPGIGTSFYFTITQGKI